MARRKKLVLGLANVARVFKDLPKENLKRITNALNVGANEMVARAKSIAPVSVPKAGEEHVKDTIRRTRIRRKLAGKRVSERVQILILAGRGGKQSETNQAALQAEFGRKPGPSPKRKKTDPSPFFFPAYHSLRKRIRGRVAREVNKAAKAVAARGRSPK